MESVFIGWAIFALLVAFLGSDRKIGFGMALLWSVLLSPLIGLIIVLTSPSNNEATKHVYKQYIESAKKAEFKGNMEKAIDCYQDALYHLKNDYKGVDKSREALIVQIEGIISKLQTKQAKNQDSAEIA